MKMLKKVTMSCTHAPKSPRIFGVAVSATYTAKYDFKGVLMKKRINSQNFRRHATRVRFRMTGVGARDTCVFKNTSNMVGKVGVSCLIKRRTHERKK